MRCGLGSRGMESKSATFQALTRRYSPTPTCRVWPNSLRPASPGSTRRFSLFASIRVAAAVDAFLERQQRAQSQKVQESQHNRDRIMLHRYQRANCAGVPDARRRRSPADPLIVFQDRAAANKSDSRDEPLKHTRLICAVRLNPESQQKAAARDAN